VYIALTADCDPAALLPVEDLPPKRAVPTLTADECLKLQKKLIAALDR